MFIGAGLVAFGIVAVLAMVFGSSWRRWTKQTSPGFDERLASQKSQKAVRRRIAPSPPTGGTLPISRTMAMNSACG